jgi:hypothetical protein
MCGSVPPGKTREFTGGPVEWHPGPRKSMEIQSESLGLGADFLNEATLAQGSSHRSEAIESYLKGGAVVVYAEYDDAPVPLAIEGKSCRFQHTLLARLVVFPEGRK